MNRSSQEKYLGDILQDNGKLDKTIEDRVAKGYGKVSEILAILSEVPLGKYRVQMGLHLRQAMFIYYLIARLGMVLQKLTLKSLKL